MGSIMMEEPWWKGDLAAEIHRTLRLKELKLPVYNAHSPQIRMRRYFADLLAILSSRCQLCPTARHLAVYLLDLFMDRYDISVKQLYVISIACLLLASKFEEKEDKVPKLEQLNSFAYMCSLNLILTKKDLLKMELLILESFNWNLCLPTPAHYIDYYLFASVSENDLHNGWPITSMTKVRAFMEKYSHYFLEVSLQDHIFLSFRPSLVAAACVSASRICLEISPSWTTQLQLLTFYSWEQLAPCIELMLIAHDKDLREANKEKDRVVFLQQQQAVGSLALQAPTQVLFQQSRYPPLAQHSRVLSQFRSPIQDLCSAYRDSLQAPRPSGLASGSSGGALHSYSRLQASFQPILQAVSIQGPITMQVAISTEPRHCLSLTYGSSYFSGHHLYTAGCFDG
ncbi:cyclin-J-like protein isoform X2 [Hemicordylus capensis]|nr:cyclin-J-like protein isoform X2 [Hemicordylus capensis]XP_053157188.1 cyclin-J-like protein isoform X2 [Hemicordylus capensis]XP_053157189.1 cyclin-J-like protein isoform X2 [Hemicordylus capensis]XP_053157190.1 cyclin-J-like protein isoform X2 [Hemicordylus capensis]